MMVCNRSPASPRCCAPINLTRIYRQVKGPSGSRFLGGPSLVDGGSSESRSTWCCPSRSGPRHIFNTEPRIKDQP
jgi:hypothetical protein